MPRQRRPVKTKLPLRALGAVDLHFHGAYGIDLMRADRKSLNDLSRRLWAQGLSGLCPTTLSASPGELAQAVENLGAWIRSGEAPGARPLGIHLEGPFISPKACGAHLPGTIRPFQLTELEELWHLSQNTLKILTIAPEILSLEELKALARWARKRGIVLSAGHSQATQKQAEIAFKSGVSGVTHAWNAMSFHHRAPGIMGAALGRRQTHIELIIDGIHVDPALIRWTLALHPERLCFVSDCAPAAALKHGQWVGFGPLRVQYSEGACRLEGGALAGGGILLPQAYLAWVRREARAQSEDPSRLLRRTLRYATSEPLRALGLNASLLRDRPVTWSLSGARKEPKKPR